MYSPSVASAEKKRMFFMEAIAKNRRKAAFWRRKPRVGRKEAGEEYREIAEKAAQGIMVLQDGSVRYANARARVFFNTLSGELTLESLANRVHPDDRPMAMDRYARRLCGEEVPKVYSFRVVTDDDRILWLEFSVSMIEWEGRPAILVLAENITERKKMEAELAESQKTIRALLDASPAVEFLLGTDGKILIYNKTFERIFGEDGKPLVGRNIQDLLSPEENQVNKSKAMEALTTGKPVFFEDYQRGAWLEKCFNPILDEKGQVTKIACYGRDITEQKRAADALKENELRYRLMAENISDYIWSTDRNLCLTYVSPGVTRLLGYTPEELMAKKLEDQMTPDSVALVRKLYAQEMAKEKKGIKEQPQPQVLVAEYRRKDGSTFWVEIQVNPVFNSEGKIVSIVGNTHDISDRKKAEEELRESEAKFRELFNNASDLIFVNQLTEDMKPGRLLEVNDLACRKLGYTREELLKLHLPDISDGFETIAAHVIPEIAARMKTSGSTAQFTFEDAFKTKDGRLLPVEISLVTFPLKGQKLGMAIARDITERKKAEEAARRLAEENALMAEITRIIGSSLNIEEVYGRFAEEVRKLIEFENITIVLINPEERSVAITHVSGIPIPGREVGTILPLEGTSAGKVYETRSSLLIHKEDLEEAVRKFPKLNAAFEAGMRSMIIVPLIREDRVFGILNIASSKPAPYTRTHLEIAEKVAAQIAGAIANAQLFQELHRTVEALKESELRNRNLVEAAGISGLGIVVFKNDKRGRVFCRFANEEAQKITGYTEEELSRTPFQEIIHPVHRETALRQYWSLVGGEQEPVLYQVVVRNKKGHTVLIEISAARTVFRGEECMIGFFRDISERKRAERELADYRAHLEKMVEERTAQIRQLEQQRGEIEKMAATGVLAARIAHEINNPLAGIKGSFMLIQDAIPRDHPYHHYVGRIHGEINRIARIVHQMFELYRSPEENEEEWEIDQMIQDVVALLRDEARERKVSFQLPVFPLKVKVPAGPIRQVLFNVIKNAVEASPLEGQVRVSVQGGENEISIQVADEGPGISEKNRPHIFKPFFSTKKGRQKGLGLGLPISKEIVESLGGSMKMQNLRGKGLLCQIDFPGRKRIKGNTDG